MSRYFRLSVALSLLSLVNSQPSRAQFHVSQLQSLSRSGAQVGETFELSVIGDKLDEADVLYFSHPAISSELKTLDPLPFSPDRQPHYGNFTVHVPTDVPPGRYEVRAGGRHGLTNPRAFLVSKFPNEILSTNSHDRNAPQPITADRVFHGAATANSIDWFAVEIMAGQSLAIDLLAQQLDSATIGQLKLYDSVGQTVATSRGVDNIDPQLRLVGLPAGQYLLAVHDFMYRGGSDFHYQLVVRGGDEVGSMVEKTADQIGQLPTYWSSRASTLRTLDGLSASEIEQTADPESISVPFEATRWFSVGQTDHEYQFFALKDQQLAIDVVSQRCGQPTDARLIVQRIEPQTSGSPVLHDVLQADDGPNINDGVVSLSSKDPVALFTSPLESSYRLSIRDLDIGTSLRPRQSYRLRIREPDPGFDLVAYRVFPSADPNVSQPFASKLFRGGAEMIRVFALRRDGWTGPINVNVQNLPDGVTCGEAVIAANQDKTQLTLVASEQAAGLVRSIEVIGHSEDGAKSCQAVPITIVRGRSHGRNAIRTRLTSSLPVAVSQQDLSPLTLTLGDGNIAEIKQGEALSLPIRIVRRDGGNTPCLFRPRDFPPGVAAGEVTIAADASEGKIELKPGGNTNPGSYSIWLQAETKIKLRPNPQALERAQAYRKHLQILLEDPAQATQAEAIQAAIVEADKSVEAAKAAAGEQELTVFIPTNHATIRVVQP